jgi:hypothetical protein
VHTFGGKLFDPFVIGCNVMAQRLNQIALRAIALHALLVEAPPLLGVILVPDPLEEIEVVKEVFRLYVIAATGLKWSPSRHENSLFHHVLLVLIRQSEAVIECRTPRGRFPK